MSIPDFLASATERGASDIHLCAGLPPLIRVDGDIEPLVSEPVLAREIRAWIEDMATDKDRLDFAQRHEADFSLALPAVGRFRVNVFESRRGPGAVFRSVPETVPTLRDLGLGSTFQRIAEAQRGLVLVTGPTGSGKSTTLAAMIDHVNRTRRGHILTIEDPIEFVHEPRNSLVNQREVGRDTSTLSGALRAALREDPDVILIGELRDLESIRLALTAAETGHLVFASLHTPSAPKAVDRILTVFPAGEMDTIRSLLSEPLHAVIWQTLLKREDAGGGHSGEGGTGRRIAVHEILVATTAVRNLIREQKIAQIY
ncbi:MAG: PilT/PilU family type 4a pilus ATPase, partial [Gammaproteobacteria bacterium]|nr:PilT/PilU family type 4a pilus ATPase [Gammaproteobacteria bacterium]